MSRPMSGRDGYLCNTPGAPHGTASCLRQLELRALAQETHRVLVNHAIDNLRRMSPTLHFECRIGYRQRNADTPIACAVHPKSLAAIHLHHVDRSRSRALGL